MKDIGEGMESGEGEGESRREEMGREGERVQKRVRWWRKKCAGR